nr:hypothetical protein [Thermosynechococcus sp. M3746_W2019_013]
MDRVAVKFFNDYAGIAYIYDAEVLYAHSFLVQRAAELLCAGGLTSKPTTRGGKHSVIPSF